MFIHIIKLLIIDPPGLPTLTVDGLEVSDTLNAIEGNNIRMRCVSESEPEPLYNWTFGYIVNSGQYLTLYNVHRNSTATVLTCHVSNVMTPSFGNLVEGNNSRSTKLNVLCK